MGIDDESSHPELCSEVAGGVTRNIVSLFREPDAVTPPVRFDEREQETEPGQTGLRRAGRKPNPIATGRLTSLRLFSTLPSGAETMCFDPRCRKATVSGLLSLGMGVYSGFLTTKARLRLRPNLTPSRLS